MKHSHFASSATFLLFFFPSFLVSSQSCQKNCGNLPLRYPFGGGSGCGNPRFQAHVTCSQQQVPTFTTHTGSYPITSIDYDMQVIFISDPRMSTCFCFQPSHGFGLDWDAPFTFHDDNVFALLNCSTNSSPLYQSNAGSYNGSTFPVPLCDSEGAPICSLLYSCNPINALEVPVSTCCVYAPVDLGPSFEMDLGKLRCSSYSGVYGYRESDGPENWNFGVALRYKFNVDNDYPSLCNNCEKSSGVCGYHEPDNSFNCICPGGVNTTSDCFIGSYWGQGSALLPWQRTGGWLICYVAWFLACSSIFT